MSTPTIRTATHASESGHWYSLACEQIAEVPTKTGGYRAPTLRDARVHDWAPGVTTILRCADKPQLVEWVANQRAMAALTLPRKPDESDADFLARVREDGRAQASEAAAEGSRIHAAVQQAIEGKPFAPAYERHVAGVLEVLHRLDTRWTSERTVIHRFGYGTKIDLLSRGWLLDIKGKDGDQAKLDNEPIYDEHTMQLVAGQAAVLYSDKQQGLPERDLALGILFVSRTHPGACSLRVLDDPGDAEGMRAWDMFQALLHYWQAKQRHYPFRSLRESEAPF